MKDPWYLVPAKGALASSADDGVGADDDIDESIDGRAIGLLVLPPSAPRLPRRVWGRKKRH